MENENKLSSYRVTDLPQLSDLNGQDLFLITHSKPAGGWESQSIPFRRLMTAVKNRGFKEELQVLEELNVNAVRADELTAYATLTAMSEADAQVGSQASAYTDQEIAKLDFHTHANLSVLSTITSNNISQWNNDVGYLTAHQSLTAYAEKQWVEDKGYLTEHQSLSDYASKQWVEDKGYQKKTVFRDWS